MCANSSVNGGTCRRPQFWLKQASGVDPRRRDWETDLKKVEEELNCHIIICSADGRLRKASTWQETLSQGS